MRRSAHFLSGTIVFWLAVSLSSAFAQAPPGQDAPTQAPPAQPAPGQASPAETPAPPAVTYQPKFAGDPARSDSEASALAYMRVVLRAQRQFNKQYNHFATALPELVHSGSFTKRMVNTNRGDYVAHFEGKKDSFVLTMTPKQLDAQHRSFYAEDDFKIHADDSKLADANSPVVK
ncbi:MAG TPA: hypothetical protein VKR60_12815 [Candidatus Sulfotelmatobacter sp.]|nr:hypothetical protein [Candidatus Sulfotelmatobacter sp.]